MSFKDLSIDFSYETGTADPINNFYIPVLKEANSYDRIAGYFSSTSLAISARGIKGLIKNGGKMRIIASPHLSHKDLEIIKNTNDTSINYIEKNFLDTLENIEDEFQKDHLNALGWMLSNNLLEIKLAFVIDGFENINDSALFHQKVGLLKDTLGNYISFSGSINETAAGWLNNIEEFKVFKSWIDGQKQYLEKDQIKFNQFWNSERANVRVISVSDAIKDKLVEMGKQFEFEDLITEKYFIKQKKNKVEDRLSLFDYQKKAIEKWMDNDYKLLFEMATGTGKTRTALGCVNKLLNIEQKLICIISSPQGTLSRQWKTEIDNLELEFDSSIIIDGTNKCWKEDLKLNLYKISVGYYSKIVIYTTHITCSKGDFIKSIENDIGSVSICFIGDEVHGLGSAVNNKGLLLKYKYRIGLSATPKRWFDDVGTSKLVSYFGDNSFEFTIADALSTINPITGKPFLVNYYYNPIFIKLTEDEFYEYEKLTNKVRKMFKFKDKTSDKYQNSYEQLLFKRANIQKNAMNKYDFLVKILKKIKCVENTIIFTSSEQIDETMNILKDRNIAAHKYTQKQGTKIESKFNYKSERMYLIDKFKEGKYKVLVAIKCLDEGIDIPSARIGILMANSSNPREYIQRVGRVIRQSPNKNRAYIYDFIIEPSIERFSNSSFADLEKSIFEKELKRVKYMSMNSINNAEVLDLINEKIRRISNGFK